MWKESRKGDTPHERVGTAYICLISAIDRRVRQALARGNVKYQILSGKSQTRAQTPAGVPIPSSPSPPPQSSPHPPGDLSTAPTSFVTAPPTIVSRTTDSGGAGRTPEMWNSVVRNIMRLHICG